MAIWVPGPKYRGGSIVEVRLERPGEPAEEADPALPGSASQGQHAFNKLDRLVTPVRGLAEVSGK